MDYVNQLKQMAKLIALENTGTPVELARQLNIDEQLVKDRIRELEELYAVDISYVDDLKTFRVSHGHFPMHLFKTSLQYQMN
ncbi:MAG TPA: hypothetical protein VJ937_11050 [Salinivirga sp.]|uniref:hypothetical protein n=1 Tax=Salinivirga sp. TaxID=1970192 RepID=UPI002B45BB97|nr:hypothetical protein [Salinivirga sp.]HKK60008.1 hypothetical protein [Salinivirga sp.]